MTQFCTFTLGDLHFGIETLHVQEVIRNREMTPIPLAPGSVRGLINLRGQIVTAVDMRIRLELPPRGAESLPMNVIVRTDDGGQSLLVDEIGDVVEVDDDTYESPPDTVPGTARSLLRGVFKLQSNLLLELDADKLFAAIQQTGEYKAAVMHSDIGQKDREKALQGFRSGEYEIIVATDLAARGLDVSGVTHVINYMVPEHSEDYVHRIGRTGRAQKEGDAFTLFAADEIMNVASIERLISQKIPRRKLEGFPYKYTTVLDDEDRARGIMTGRKKKRR